jgi:hypothetical protein
VERFLVIIVPMLALLCIPERFMAKLLIDSPFFFSVSVSFEA